MQPLRNKEEAGSNSALITLWPVNEVPEIYKVDGTGRYQEDELTMGSLFRTRRTVSPMTYDFNYD